MIGDAVHYVDLAFGWLVTQVDKLFVALPGAMDLILGVFSIYLASRLLLKPLFGMSDGVLNKVKKNRMNNKQKSSSKSNGD